MSLQDTHPCLCGERVNRDFKYCPHCAEPVESDWPLKFAISATGQSNTLAVVKNENLPHSDAIMDALYHYPGEVRIHYKLTESLDVIPLEMEYNGTTWVPEEEV
jgi:predicted amidophosphoribosyltransferase